jgi:hypothetical protein
MAQVVVTHPFLAGIFAASRPAARGLYMAPVQPGQHAEEFVVFAAQQLLPLYGFEFECVLQD